MKRKTNHTGFTLIEVALMLAVIGLLLGLGVSLIGPMVKRSKFVETRETVKQAREALVGYAVKHGFLPYQDEDYDAGRPAEVFTHVGLKGTDAFGRALLYVVAPELEWDNATPVGESDCRIPLRVDLCTLSKTSMTVNYEGLDRDNVAFMVVSAGENQNLQTGMTIYGVDFPNIDDFDNDTNRPEPYDDVVEFVSLDELRRLRNCRNLEVLTPRALPVAEEKQPYAVTLEAQGGVPPYTWVPDNVTMPGGLQLSPSGTLSTVKLDPGCNATLNLAAKVCDSAGQSHRWSGTLPVRLTSPRIATTELPVGYENRDYNALIVADGCHPPCTWNLSVAPKCPEGLLCRDNKISGIPSQGSSGAYKVEAELTDRCQMTTAKTFGLTIHPAYAGDNGTNGDNGTGGSYELRIVNRGTPKSYRIDYRSCVNMSKNSQRSEFISERSRISFFVGAGCRGAAILSVRPASWDNNRNFLIQVECTGNDNCEISDR